MSRSNTGSGRNERRTNERKIEDRKMSQPGHKRRREPFQMIADFLKRRELGAAEPQPKRRHHESHELHE
jgi:hypothetical protein